MLVDTLDVLIGLISVLLILSLIVSAVGEGVSAVSNLHGRILRRAICRLLGRRGAAAFYAHEKVAALRPARNGKLTRLPSYVQDTLFADVVLDLCVNPPRVGAADPPQDKAPGQTTEDDRVKAVTAASLEHSLRNPSPVLADFAPSIRALWVEAGGDVDVLRNEVIAWFNRTGERSRGWFKRELGYYLFFVGLVAAAFLNADTIYMFQRLSDDDALRRQFVDRATELVEKVEADPICEAPECRQIVESFVLQMSGADRAMAGAAPVPGTGVAPPADGAAGPADAADALEAGAAPGPAPDVDGAHARPANTAPGDGDAGRSGAQLKLDERQRKVLAEQCGMSVVEFDRDRLGCAISLRQRLAREQRVCAAFGLEEGECSGGKLLGAALPELLPLLGWDLWAEQIAELQTGPGQDADGAGAAVPAKDAGGGADQDGSGATTRWAGFVLVKGMGLVLTAFAVSLGAPFWFDLLERFAHVRSSIRPATTAPVPPSRSTSSEPLVARGPAARAVIRTRSAPASVFDDLGSFEHTVFGFSPVNLYWSARLSRLVYSREGALITGELEAWGAEGLLLTSRDVGSAAGTPGATGAGAAPAGGMLDGVLADIGADTQCLVATTPRAAMVSFRGTEKNAADWLTNVRITPVAPAWAQDAGYRVHEGFDAALEAIWPALQDHLQDALARGLPIWLSGHSLGGALATLCALRLDAHIKALGSASLIAALHTYGQPRVGDQACAQQLEKVLPARYFRSVNQRDVVPRVPLPTTPAVRQALANPRADLEMHDYAHAGRVIYFTDVGRAVMDPPLWYRKLDSLAVGVRKAQVREAIEETVGDHAIGAYVALHGALLHAQSGEEA